MGYATLNWNDINAVYKPLLTEGVTVADAEYLILLPDDDGDNIVSFGKYLDDDIWWILEVANGDPGQTKMINLVGGVPGQDPPQIILPPGKTNLTLPPGYAQRLVFAPGIGWIPLLQGGVLT